MPQEQFVTAWNGAGTLSAVSARLKELTGVYIPGWALMVRALELRKNGVELKVLVRSAPLSA